MRARLQDEARFLPDQAIHPGRVDLLLVGDAEQLFGKGGRKADLVVGRTTGGDAFLGVDGPVEQAVPVGPDGRGPQVGGVEAAHLVIPFAVGLAAQAQCVKGHRLADAGAGVDGGHQAFGGCLGCDRWQQCLAQFLARQLAVVIVPLGQGLEKAAGSGRMALGLAGTGVPVGPGGAVAQLGLHLAQDPLQQRPVLGGQRGAGLPDTGAVADGGLQGFPGPAQGRGIKTLSALGGHLRPQEAAVGTTESQVLAGVELLGGLGRIEAGQAGDGDARQHR